MGLTYKGIRSIVSTDQQIPIIQIRKCEVFHHRTSLFMVSRLGIFFSLLLFLAQLRCSSGIHVLGIDRNGVRDFRVPAKVYSKHMGESLADIHDSALISANHFLKQQRYFTPWVLNEFNIGVGIEGKVSVIGLATFAARPRIRLFFSQDSPIDILRSACESRQHWLLDLLLSFESSND